MLMLSRGRIVAIVKTSIGIAKLANFVFWLVYSPILDRAILPLLLFVEYPDSCLLAQAEASSSQLSLAEEPWPRLVPSVGLTISTHTP